MKLKLPSSLFSAQDLTSVILEIKAYAKWYQHVDIKNKVSGGSQTEPPTISDAASELISEWAGKNENNAANMDALITALEDFKNHAPSVSISLAALPSGELKHELSAWCRKNIAPNVLVNFRFDSTLLGGIVLRYNSHIYDWSFRRHILANRQKFPEVLRRV